MARAAQYYESSGRILPADFYTRPTAQVARDLLGALLVRNTGDGVLSGIIVETEAYLPEGDEANHSHRGLTPRNAAMFEQGGVLYVYKIYGIHHCLNFVTEERGRGCAVLIRALEPVQGIEQMQKRRAVQDKQQLCNGPGKVAQALALTTGDSFISACGADIFVQEHSYIDTSDIVATPRIGISKATDLPLRFYIRGSAYVSRLQRREQLPLHQRKQS